MWQRGGGASLRYRLDIFKLHVEMLVVKREKHAVIVRRIAYVSQESGAIPEYARGRRRHAKHSKSVVMRKLSLRRRVMMVARALAVQTSHTTISPARRLTLRIGAKRQEAPVRRKLGMGAVRRVQRKEGVVGVDQGLSDSTIPLLLEGMDSQW